MFCNICQEEILSILLYSLNTFQWNFKYVIDSLVFLSTITLMASLCFDSTRALISIRNVPKTTTGTCVYTLIFEKMEGSGESY